VTANVSFSACDSLGLWQGKAAGKKLPSVLTEKKWVNLREQNVKPRKGSQNSSAEIASAIE